MNKGIFSFGIIAILSFCINKVYAQCVWQEVLHDSYEYTTVVPDLIPGTTYQNTPQTFAGCVNSGTYGLYMNIVDGYTGQIYDRIIEDVCIGQDYQFAFWTRDAFTSNNDLTFNVYDANDVLLSTQNVLNNSTWINVMMPVFSSTTSSIRFEIVTNLPGAPGNDVGFDDLRLMQCAPQEIVDGLSYCADMNDPEVNLYSLIENELSNNGSWSGPGSLDNGYLGTFTAGITPNGVYTYSIDNGPACFDSLAIISTEIIGTPILDPVTPVSECGSYILPAISGTNLSGLESYYTGPGATGTQYFAGDQISSSTTLYIYDGLPGCFDEVQLDITINSFESAGGDYSEEFCAPSGVFDLNNFLTTTSTNGVWEETSAELSGSFNNVTGVFDANDIDPGVYTFTYTLPPSGSCLGDEALITLSFGTIDPIDLGNDTLIMCNSQLVLSAPAGYSSYLWNTGSTQSSITVSQPGTYFCQGVIMQQNVVLNGDFSQGNIGFQSDYVLGTGGTWGQLSNPGTYAVTSNASLVHNNFAPCFDHTVGDNTGSMLVVNGSAVANAVVWGQDITVTPNTDYQFSVWASSVVSDNPGILRFSINGVQVGAQLNLSNTTCNWQQFFVVWNSGAATSAEISIINQNTLDAGNDFALDDISFSPFCSFYDEIVVSVPPSPTISVTPNSIICEGESIELTANTSADNPTYNWMPGAINQSSIEVSPSTTTVYSVNVTDENNCTSSTVQTVVTVRPRPQLTVTQDLAICFGESIELTVSSNIAVDGFDWNSGAHSGTQWTVSPTDTTIYTVSASSTAHGCESTESVQIAVIPPLDIFISGELSFCEGASTMLTANSNALGTMFFWEPSNVIANQLLVDEQNEGWIYLTGQNGSCPLAHDSVQVEVISIPTVNAPNDFVVCPGETINAIATSDNSSATILWNTGQEGASIQLTVQESSIFFVTANYMGCISEPDSFFVDVSGICALEVPNVFTPNNDGNNDVFKLISHQGIISLEVVVFNRWGNNLFSSSTPDFVWDGNDSSGRQVTEGTYFYKIEAQSASGEYLSQHGFVQLVR